MKRNCSWFCTACVLPEMCTVLLSAHMHKICKIGQSKNVTMHRHIWQEATWPDPCFTEITVLTLLIGPKHFKFCFYSCWNNLLQCLGFGVFDLSTPNISGRKSWFYSSWERITCLFVIRNLLCCWKSYHVTQCEENRGSVQDQKLVWWERPPSTPTKPLEVKKNPILWAAHLIGWSRFTKRRKNVKRSSLGWVKTFKSSIK